MNPFGPLFLFDLLGHTRRGRLFTVRTVYGLVLLAILGNGLGHLQAVAATTPGEVPLLAEQTFHRFLLCQLVAVLLVTPLVVGGAVAEERQRTTLQELLTTALTDREIILGKFAARIGHVGLFLLTGLPAVALLQLLGGIAWETLLLGFGAAGLAAVTVGSLGLMCSVLSPKPGDAAFRTYLVTLFLAVGTVLGWYQTPVGGWPLDAQIEMAAGLGLVVSVGSLMVAARQLRPAASRWGVERPRTTRAATRPRVGDDPLWWWEVACRVDPAVWLPRNLGPVLLASCLLIGIKRSGCIADPLDPDGVLVLAAGVTVVLLLITLVTAARALTGPRAGQLLEDLKTSPISGSRILRAKWWGAVAEPSTLACLLLSLVWLAVVHGLKPRFVPFLLAGLAAHLAFAASLGLWCAYRTRTAARSQFLALGLYGFLILGGPCLCCMPGPVVSAPWVLASPIGWMGPVAVFRSPRYVSHEEMVIFHLLQMGNVTLYALASFALWVVTNKKFPQQYRPSWALDGTRLPGLAAEVLPLAEVEPEPEAGWHDPTPRPPPRSGEGEIGSPTF